MNSLFERLDRSCGFTVRMPMLARARTPSRSLSIGLALPAFAVVLAVPSLARAANTVYVSPTGAGVECSCDAPCALTTGALLAQAGDTVFLLDGTYTDSLSPANSGTASAWITFQAAPGTLPILDGSTQSPQATGVGSATETYLRFVGIVARNWSSGFSNGFTGMGTTNSNGHFQYVNCIADMNTRNGFVFNSAQGVLVQQNIVAHNGSSTTASWSSGVQLFEVQGTAQDNVVEQNVSFENADMQNHTDGSGFIVDQMCTGASFIDNIAFRNGGSCIRLTKSSNTQVINNTCFHNGLDPQDTGPTNPGEIYFTDAASRMGVLVENNLVVASGSAADAMGLVNPPTSGVNNNFTMGAGATPFFTDPTGTNPNFRLTSSGTGSIVGKGATANAPMADIGFDPKCLRSGSPGPGIAWAENSVDYDYIKSIGGVAACFNPANRGNPPDIGAYQANTNTTGHSMAGAVACKPGTGGTGLVGFVIGPDGGLVEAGTLDSDAMAPAAEAGGAPGSSSGDASTGVDASATPGGDDASTQTVDASVGGSSGGGEDATTGLGADSDAGSGSSSSSGAGGAPPETGTATQKSGGGCAIGSPAVESGWGSLVIAALAFRRRRARSRADQHTS